MIKPVLEAGIAAGLAARSESERLLFWVKLAMAAGIAALAVMALKAGAPVSGWRFFTVGTLSALASAAAGGAFGLLFGLPISSRVTVVDQSGQSDGGAPGNWFSDNTSIEQIADWLTKIIVGLTLTQWSSIQSQFNRLAAAVSAAMAQPVANEKTQLVPAAVLRSAAAVARSDPGMVPGGLLIGSYALLGFLLVYVWARRYLSAELAAGRRDLLEKQAAAEKAFRSKAADAGGVQEKPKNATTPMDLLSATRAAEESAQPAEVPTMPFDKSVPAGTVPDDPWKGQFGGHSTDGRIEVTATVEELQTQKGWFGVELVVRAATVKERIALVGKQARIYLHPTFANSIRLEKFGTSGEIRLPLVCYEGFTVGVHISDGRLFELDLCALPGAPAAFRGI